MLHSEVLSTFIPITLYERLKQDLVYRPQVPEESLPIYITEIKINSEILRTMQTEQQVVSFIKNGIDPTIKNKLVFENNPCFFQD